MSTYILEHKNLPHDSVSIHRSVLRDPELSLKAKGLHAFMRTMPNHWVFNVVDLTSRLREGKDAITVALKELVDAGYVDRDRPRGEGGVFMGYLYVVYPVHKDIYLEALEAEREREAAVTEEQEPQDLQSTKADYPALENPQLVFLRRKI